MSIGLCVTVPYDFIFFIYLFTVLFMFCLIYSLVLAILNVGLTRGYIEVFAALWSSSDLLLTFCNTKSLRWVLKNKVCLRLVGHSCDWGAFVLFYKTCSFLTWGKLILIESFFYTLKVSSSLMYLQAAFCRPVTFVLT